MLKTISEKEKPNWKDHIDKLLCAYDCTHKPTRHSTCHVLIGQKPQSPADIVLNIKQNRQNQQFLTHQP